MVTDRLAHEKRLTAKGMTRLAGVDEAGRGPLAGPVVAAAVLFPCGWIEDGLPEPLEGLNDSKQLTETQRERFFEFLIQCPDVVYAVVRKEAELIDQINILQATHAAMRDALARLDPPPDHALVDGRPVPTLPVPHTPLVQGDSKSYAIAAASILAKVSRDRDMVRFDEQWPEYGFREHKGYGTARHLAALAEHGPCPIHRRSFAPLRGEQLELI